MLRDKKMIGLILLVFAMSMGGCGGADDITYALNHHPEIDEIIQLQHGIHVGGQGTIICVASDLDGDVLSYEWTAYIGSLITNQDTAIWVAPLEVSMYPFKCRVEDGHGGYDERSFEIQVYE